ncbi:MAG TPA: hypothetical protein VLT59_00780 [Steroidobacteraceae bacterium]|nr:hypothetical protein [Steroidobacteraceae bacterium]
MSTIDSRTVLNLAEAQGYRDLTAEFAERVAAGADRAVRAVRESVGETLFDCDPASFLSTLEALAEPETQE